MIKTYIHPLTALCFCLGATVFAQTATFTPNPSLTPPCITAGVFGNNGTGNAGGVVGTYPMMRGSVYTLTSPATVYSLTVYCESPPANMQLMTGIYSGVTDDFGSRIVASSAQTVVNGWNGFPITPTYLTAGTYWLAYMWNEASYDVDYTSSSTANIEAFTSSSTGLTFGTMPSTMPTPSYGTGKELIYALYCLLPTNTPTITDTPTITPTPTSTSTVTNTYTQTQTGTINTFTPTFTNTFTSTVTDTQTMTATYTLTPNLSLTPSCGGSFISFGDSSTAGSPVTASYTAELRACRYTLSTDSTVQTMSLYCTNYSAGSTAEVAIYSNGASDTLGTLMTQSSTQVLTAGWNIFPVPSAAVTAGDYWLTYVFSAPVSYSLVNQTSPAAVTTLAYTNNVPSWTLYSSGSSYSPSYANNWYEPILANVCPGLSTSTSTATPTFTGTPVPTGTSTSTATATSSATSTGTATPTSSGTNTQTLTATISASNTASATWTDTAGNTATETATSSSTCTASQTSTNTVTMTATLTGTNTDLSTSTSTGTATSTSTATNTPTCTATNTGTATAANSYTSTETATGTATNSPTQSSTMTGTGTSSPTVPFTATQTNTGTVSMTSTVTNTFSITNTPTATYTGTVTPLVTPTSTVTSSFTPTNTALSGNTATSTGTPSASPTVSTTATWTVTPASTDTLSLFPNPVTGNGSVNLQINFSQAHDYVSIKVFTTAFRKIYDTRLNYVQAGTLNYSIGMDQFKGGGTIANGLYYVVVTTPSNRWLVKLLVLR